jgi:hypothetical protein
MGAAAYACHAFAGMKKVAAATARTTQLLVLVVVKSVGVYK